ncbi:protein SRC2-like [Fagus crenata]
MEFPCCSTSTSPRPSRTAMIVVKLKSHHKAHNDKDIGEVRVPIAELLASCGDADAAAAAAAAEEDDDDDDEKQVMISKSVVTSDGIEEGTLAFSYNFGTTLQHPPADPPLVPVKSRRHKAKKVAVKVTGAMAAAFALGAVEQLGADVVPDFTSES